MRTPAIHWHVAAPAASAPDASWWNDLETTGLFELARKRPVVVYVARNGSDQRVVATARGLLAFLRHRFPDATVEILDPRGRDSEWPGVRRIDLERRLQRRIAAPCIPNGLEIPDRWLEPFFLVTIAPAAPHPRYLVSSVLAAQAELLGRQPALDLDLVFEAHRVLAADLNVTCGPRVYGDERSESWWAASAHDASLEGAIAIAAGAEPLTLPQLAHLARHETAPMVTTAASPHAPRLERYLAPHLGVRRARALEWSRYWSETIGTDLRLAAANLKRIPQFVRRRWPRAAQAS